MQHLRDRKKRVDMSLVKSKSLTPIFQQANSQALQCKKYKGTKLK